MFRYVFRPSSGWISGHRRALSTMDNSSAEIKIWWDVNSARLPLRVRDAAENLMPNIRRALNSAGYEGSIWLQGWSHKGINEDDNNDVIHGLDAMGAKGDIYIAEPCPGEDSREVSSRYVLLRMLMSMYRDKPPCNHLLITGNKTFLHPLKILKERGYNILVARPPSASSALDYNIATTVWDWEDLVKGKPPLLPNVCIKQ